MMRPGLGIAALTALIAPIAIGAVTAPHVGAQQITIGTSQPAGGQTSDSSAANSNATFEVASVKPNKSGDGRVMIAMPPTGRYTATNVPLRFLLQNAYNVQPFQIVGGPSWIGSDRFDIVAKAPDGFTPDQLRPMVRALLADRFKLKSHLETREMPIYELVLARADGKLGPNITPSKTDCKALMAQRRGGPPPAPPQPGQPLECSMMLGAGNLNGGGMEIAQLARTLGPLVNRIVNDKTGLKGEYDFQLTFSPEGRGGFPGVPGGPPAGIDAPAADPNRPSLFTALQEQLGLKLDSQKGPVEVLVIDSVEQPTED